MYKVDKAILHVTANCLDDFSCLSGNKKCLCDVVASNEEDIVKIKSSPIKACKYCIALDSAFFCHCPTRVEIYKKYRA